MEQYIVIETDLILFSLLETCELAFSDLPYGEVGNP